MSTIPTILVTPTAAAQAYAKAANSVGGSPAASAAASPTSGEGGFGATLQQALEQAVQTGHTADEQATQALKGGGNLTDVVVALSHAEMTLQTATAIRDRVVQAYQDIIKMPI
jgi:flagellar hook-basal body complex protein FliE